MIPHMKWIQTKKQKPTYQEIAGLKVDFVNHRKELDGYAIVTPEVYDHLFPAQGYGAAIWYMIVDLPEELRKAAACDQNPT